MPPRRKSVPAARVYKSATPLQQTKLTVPKKRIKSYGKKSTRRAKEDSTLTQIGFIQLGHNPDDEEGQEEEEQESDYEEASKKRNKRRKTMDDRPSATPQWHTQTLTQLDRSFSSNAEAEEQEEEVVVKKRSIFDVPSSSPRLPTVPRNTRSLSRPVKAASTRREESPIMSNETENLPVPDMPPPQTPRRVMRQEIPSSQSPATPLSLPSRGSSRLRSPLKEQSGNVAIPFNTNYKPQPNAKKPPKLKIEDTFESGNTTSQAISTSPAGKVPSSPDKRPSPAKSVRFALPQEEEVETPATPSVKKKPTPFTSRIASQHVKFEILDSDEEEEADSEVEASQEDSLAHPNPSASLSREQQAEEPETFYGDIGRETQFEADLIVSSLKEKTPSSTPGNESESEQVATGETQIGETQRVSTQHVTSMPPRTEISDIFISLHPKHVTDIVNRTKNHEFRVWAFPPSVCRIWIYETAPISTLKYMAYISDAKKPGQIVDENGLGNADFNAKPRNKSHNAYEILELYELADPLPLSQIISNGWMKAAPQKFTWVRPAVADELIANLKPPLFTGTTQDDEPSASSDTQEVEDQLLNTISQFTQPTLQSQPPASQAVAVKTESMGPPSSTHPETPRKSNSPLRPSQAETVDLTQIQLPDHPSQEEEDDIVWESPARPVPSSPPLKLPTPRSARSDPHGSDPILPYSMSSSQFLSRSQLLPESLLNQHVPGPPRFIHDSDSEDDEL